MELEPLKSDERGTIYPWEAEKGKVSDPDQADKDCELPENIFRSGKTLFLGLNLGVELFPIFDELGYSISPTFELGAVVNPHLSITLEMYSEVYILFNLAFVLKSTFYFQRGNSAYIVAGIGYGCVLQANVGFGYEWFIGDSGAVGISLRYDPLIVDEQEAIHQAGLFVTFRYYL